MSLFLAVTLAAAIQPACSWDNPGRNPYTGSTAAAIDRYTDIPVAVRSTLKRRMEEHLTDDTVNITRDSISGKSQYNPAIRDMHFGAASVCHTVSRSKWSPSRIEPAAVYCVGEHCIMVPKICGNVSRVRKLAPAVAARSAGNGRDTEFGDVSAGNGSAGNDKVAALLNSLDEQAAIDDINNLPGTKSGNGPESYAQDPSSDFGRYISFGGGGNGINSGGGGGGAGGGGGGVITTPVPEADTWAMMVAGLGLIGWLGRRRARKAAQTTE